VGKCGSHAAGNGLIGDRERDASRSENFSRRLFPDAAGQGYPNEFAVQALK